jgi:hypothetical protein
MMVISKTKGAVFHTQLHSMAFGAFLVGRLLRSQRIWRFADGCINEGSNTASKMGRMALMMVQIPRLEDEAIYYLVRAFYDYELGLMMVQIPRLSGKTDALGRRFVRQGFLDMGLNDGSDTASSTDGCI